MHLGVVLAFDFLQEICLYLKSKNKRKEKQQRFDI